jgi:hypothetical protein
MLELDQIYRYRSMPALRQGYCRLRIYAHRGGRTVVLTEIANNPGQSITAGSDLIATALAARYQLDPATTTWIEHWPADNNNKRSNESYTSVKYTWKEGIATSPRWRSLSLEQAEALVGSTLALSSIMAG